MHVGWWCDKDTLATGASEVPGLWGVWEATSANVHHELLHGGVFRLYPAAVAGAEALRDPTSGGFDESKQVGAVHEIFLQK